MPFFSQTEQKNEKSQLSLQKLMREVERLEQETAHIFSQVGITPEQFDAYTENPANFSLQEWDNLKKYELALEERLTMLQSQAEDIEKVKQKRADLRLSQHWLPVR